MNPSLPIAELLEPFLDLPLDKAQLKQVETYLDLLVRWNAKMNLTAVRDPRDMVTRHFGESFFAARILRSRSFESLIDIGSGAGFPGVPIKIADAEARVTLIESQSKKAIFLREVVRSLELHGIDVQQARAEVLAGQAEVVSFRAVESFSSILKIAAGKVAQGGRLCLLIGESQFEEVQGLSGFSWDRFPIPGSSSRIVALGDFKAERKAEFKATES